MPLSSWKSKIGTGLVGFAFGVMVAQEPNEHAMDHGMHPAPEPGPQISKTVAPFTTSAVEPIFLRTL